MTLLTVTKTIPGYLVQLVILLALLGIKLGRLAEERRRGIDLDPRRPTVAASACLIVGLSIGVMGKFVDGFTELFNPYVLQYLQNVITASTYFCLLFLYRPAGGLRVPAVRREVALFAGACSVLAVLSGLMWFGDLPHDDSAATLAGHPTTGVFYLVALGYFAYLDLSVAVPTLRYLRQARGWLRVGLALVAAAAMMHAVAVTTRFVAVVLSMTTGGRPELLYAIASPLYNLGNPVLILGLVAPLLAGRLVATRRWATRRVRYSRMRTLATTALTVFPEVERPAVALDGTEPGQAPAEATARPNFRFRYVGRVTRCRDAINRAEGFSSAVPTPSESRTPAERFWAELIACGVDDDRNYPTLDEEAAAYAELSARLRKRDPSWAAEEAQPASQS